jgi:signal transduction histidine kinase
MEDLEKTGEDISTTRFLVKKCMRSIACDQMVRLFIHDFKNSVGEMDLALRVLKHEFHKFEMIHKKNRIIDAFQTIDNSFKLLIGGLEWHENFVDHDSKIERFEISSIIEVAVNLFESQARRKNITFLIKISDGHSIITGNRIDLILVFFNIIHNAIESMNTPDASGPMIKIIGNKNNRQYVVTLCDQGCGIIAEHISKIFEPGFTTKTATGVAGMGLFSASMIMDRHQGSIRLLSTKIGKGSNFEIKLPLSQ